MKAFKFDTVVLKPNIVGEVLSELRTEMKEADKESLVKVGGAIEETSQTEDDVKNAKKGAIINSLRNRIHF